MTRTRGWYWPWLLGAGMLGIVGVNVGMLFTARGDRNGAVVEPDYYRKAVTWDSTMARRGESARLGWTATVTLEADARAAAPTAVRIELEDAGGAPVDGASVAATLIHNADAGRPLSVRLRERASGAYEGTAQLAFPGRWEVRIVATRGTERFEVTAHTDLLRREAPPTPATAAPIVLPLPAP